MIDIKGGADMCSAKAANLAVYSLVKLGKVYRTNPGGKGIQALYSLKQVVW
jgi:hypothetical protein